MSFFIIYSLLSAIFSLIIYYSVFLLNKVWFHPLWLSAAWPIRQIVVRKGRWADKKHSSSVLVAISQQLNTSRSDRLRLPSYYVRRRKASQHYLKIRPLTTAHGKREGKWKTDKAPPNKQEQLLGRICSLLLVSAVGRLYNRRSHKSSVHCGTVLSWACEMFSQRKWTRTDKAQDVYLSMFNLSFVPWEHGRQNGISGAVKCLERHKSLKKVWNVMLRPPSKSRHRSFTHPWVWVLRIVVYCHR